MAVTKTEFIALSESRIKWDVVEFLRRTPF